MSTNLLKETMLHMLDRMQRLDGLYFNVGLIDGRPAPTAVKRVVANYLELE